MRLTVNCDGVKNISNSFDNTYNELLNMYERLSKKYDDISYYWKGEDEKKFSSKVLSYIEVERGNLENIRNISNALKSIANEVKSEEDRFKNEVKGGIINE